MRRCRRRRGCNALPQSSPDLAPKDAAPDFVLRGILTPPLPFRYSSLRRVNGTLTTDIIQVSIVSHLLAFFLPCLDRYIGRDFD